MLSKKGDAAVDFNFDQLESAKRYKLLTGLVIPRPIAWTTTLSAGGVVNAAPFSFFNVLGDDPPIVMISIENRDAGPLKDTARNILETKEFVVNLVDEDTAEKMHACSLDYPPGASEADAVGLATAPSCSVKPPRLADSPVSLECRLHTHLDMGTRQLVIGTVHWLHVRDGVIEPDTLRVRMENYHPIGRLYANRYTRTREQFALEANAYVEARARLGKA